ncbi:MAG: TRAP transporter substrate-binding protein [Rhodospirillaceae bacterium]|nr:TRAP transporter substrate-binding protein DctP [Rhodospirillaceae bacterium]MDE0703871.1 TRAP transporter substrate-binding protein DctP [Rhodospirillaceae bacterium]MYG53568.1 TRAP transporter substrate-binding protein [Rhodospirillaceae bacterium]
MKFRSTILALGAAALLAAPAAQALELKLSISPPPQTPWGKFVIRIAEKVKTASGGTLTIKNYFNDQLAGNEQNTIRQIVRGRVDLGAHSNTGISLVAPEFGLLATPFLWKDLAEADCVADKHLLPVYEGLLRKGGVVPLTWMEVGNQIVFAKKQIKTPADLAGLKLRTAPTPTDTIYMKVAGANSIPLGTAESMPALKTGVVQAATWPAVYGIAVGYHKVAPFVTVTNHSHQLGGVVISKKVWDGLNKQQQGWLLTAHESVGFLRKAVRGAEAALLGKIAKGGATVYRPNAAEMKAWRAKAPAAQAQIIKDFGGQSAEVWKRLQAARKACAA